MKKFRIQIVTWLVPCLVLIGTLSFLAYQWFVPAHQINFGSIKLIQNGMSLKEVELVLGVPPGDYRTKPVVYFWSESNGPFVLMSKENGTASCECKEWISNEILIWVWFNDQGVVFRKDYVFPGKPFYSTPE